MGTQSSFFATTGPAYQGTNPNSSQNNAEIVWVIDGSGATIGTGVKGDYPITFGCTINSVNDAIDRAAEGDRIVALDASADCCARAVNDPNYLCVVLRGVRVRALVSRASSSEERTLSTHLPNPPIRAV